MGNVREESLPMEGDGVRQQQQQQQHQQQQQLETVGEKLSQLQRSLLAKQTYLAKVIRVQRRMLLEQRAVIERLSCKLGKDNEDLELQFSAAVAKVPYVEGHDLVVENESESILAEEQDDEFLSLQRRSMLLPETSFKEEDEDEDFFEEEADDDNDSFITINTSEEDSDCSDETLENNSESNDSGVIEEPEFIINSSKALARQSSYGVSNQPPQRSYGVNPIFAAHFNSSQFEQDSLDGNAVAASREFKYVKNTKWKPASKSKKLQKTRKFHAKDKPSTGGVVIGNEVGEVSKLSAMRENETFAYNESCLI